AEGPRRRPARGDAGLRRVTDASAAMSLVPIGVVSSPLTDPAAAPKQGLDGMRPGDEIIVVTWLHRARRDILRVHPRDDLSNPERGVFTTRSADRPNPIGLHEVTVAAIDGARILV